MFQQSESLWSSPLADSVNPESCSFKSIRTVPHSMAGQAGNEIPNLRNGFTINNARLENNAENLAPPVMLLNKLLHEHFGNLRQRPFMLSKHYIDSPDDGAHWQPELFVGSGGFGKVGLWFKRDDATFATIDRMVIKQAQREDNLEWEDDQGFKVHGLASEAVTQHMMNHPDLQSRDNVLHLRQYKYFSQTDQWRFFLEHAMYGDAAVLLARYRQVQHSTP